LLLVLIGKMQEEFAVVMGVKRRGVTRRVCPCPGEYRWISSIQAYNVTYVVSTDVSRSFRPKRDICRSSMHLFDTITGDIIEIRFEYSVCADSKRIVRLQITLDNSDQN